MEQPHPERAIRRRLDSGVNSVRAGARWELWIEQLLLRSGARLERHPAVPGLTRRPDLRAELHGAIAYVEATATGGGALSGHRQPTPELRLQDVLMSRLKQKSRAFQGIDGPLLLAVLCVSEHFAAPIGSAALDELFSTHNAAGCNVSAVLVGWRPDEHAAPRRVQLRRNPRALHDLPDWIGPALSFMAHGVGHPPPGCGGTAGAAPCERGSSATAEGASHDIAPDRPPRDARR